MKELAERELDDSGKMRESLFVSRERARNTLKAQQETTEHTIRKRIFETQRARNELEWQLVKASIRCQYAIPRKKNIILLTAIWSIFFLD